MKILLWIDDYRDPFDNDWLNFSPIGKDCKVIWVKSYSEAITYLSNNWPDAISFDHDLDTEETGYDIAKYIVNRCIEDNLNLPIYSSHSANPIGRKNILSLLTNYKKHIKSQY